MNPLDFITGGVSIVNKLIELHRLDKWAKLVFGFALSWFVSSTTAAGAALMQGKPAVFAIGIGLVTGASCLIFLAGTSPETKGIMFAWIQEGRIDSSAFQAEVKK